jgi:hypothetical protein
MTDLGDIVINCAACGKRLGTFGRSAGYSVHSDLEHGILCAACREDRDAQIATLRQTLAAVRQWAAANSHLREVDELRQAMLWDGELPEQYRYTDPIQIKIRRSPELSALAKRISDLEDNAHQPLEDELTLERELIKLGDRVRKP